MEVKKGYKQTELGVIPEDWVAKSLGEISAIKGRIGWRGYTVDDLRDSGPLVIGATQISHYNTLDLSKPVYISKEKYKESPEIQVERGDILIVKTGNTIGKLTLINRDIGEACINPNTVIIRNFKCQGVFLYQLLTYSIYQKKIWDFVVVGAQPSVNQEKLKLLQIFFPPTKGEQTAIANALSDADALISKLEKLITKKRCIKQGAMQLLLIGKKRLPGFTGEWGKKRLGEVADIKKGQMITEKDAVAGNIPVIAGGIEPSYYHDTFNRNANTITISASGANAGYVSFHDNPIFASDCSTIEEGIHYDIKYLFYLLQLSQQDIFELQTGGAQPHVYPEQLKNFKTNISRDKDEQTAIAQVLSDMDAEIEALEQKLAKYRLIKRGMMHELLTGKKRLI